MPRAVVAGPAGERLTPDERALLLDRPCAGFILFQRNCREPSQVVDLTAELRALYPGRWVPILIDHEGGRVQRMKPPMWPARPAAGALGALPSAERRRAARLWAQLLAADLVALGIDVDCVPVLDVGRPETTAAIGRRAFADDPGIVAELGLLVIEVLQASGVAPVIKHLPGHGRARVDTHHELARLECSLDTLRACDFEPFRACRHAPFAMTAHIVFEALDPERPATHSRRVVQDVIRGEIGFEGILFSDDLSMNALEGPIETRARRSIEAGCDLALHCNGDFAEMRAVLAAAPPLAADRFERLQASCPPRVAPLDEAVMRAWARELDGLLEPVAGIA
ncbi:MAG: beta-N-acetylhexosaminidase [Geminicoccaceae bacterium]|nr:beta-N-acetylhexosaminidase [Geminicoccaceae bacterium]